MHFPIDPTNYYQLPGSPAQPLGIASSIPSLHPDPHPLLNNIPHSATPTTSALSNFNPAAPGTPGLSSSSVSLNASLATSTSSPGLPLTPNPTNYHEFTSRKKHEREEPLDDVLVNQIREAFQPFNDPSPTTVQSKRYLLALISEYLRDEMTLQRFFRDLATLASPISTVPGDIYRWLIHILIYSDKDPNCKLMSFLLEHGVNENDIEYGSVKRLLSMYQQQGAPQVSPSLEKTKAPRVRKSVSKGLRNPPNKWTKEESQRLIQLVNDYGDKSWKKIAEHVGGGKTGAQCAQHWKRVLCPIIRKGSWDDLEEMKLFQLVEKYGQSWKNIASEIGSRTDIQCRYQYFKSCMSREVLWSTQEDDLLMKKINDVKNENREIHWVEVARYMARGRLTKIPRTALECRSRWETLTLQPQSVTITLPANPQMGFAVDEAQEFVMNGDHELGRVPELSDEEDSEAFNENYEAEEFSKNFPDLSRQHVSIPTM